MVDPHSYLKNPLVEIPYSASLCSPEVLECFMTFIELFPIELFDGLEELVRGMLLAVIDRGDARTLALRAVDFPVAFTMATGLRHR